MLKFHQVFWFLTEIEKYFFCPEADEMQHCRGRKRMKKMA